jgi:hypothetical protein
MPFRRLSPLIALGIVLATQSAPAWSDIPLGHMAVSEVRKDVENGDCKGAVAALNRGLAAHYPEMQLLAGSLYENGVCLKPNWDRAVNFYTQAFKNGQEEAGYRLAAGFAAPERSDVASALWWASRVKLNYGGCVPTGDAANDPDKFLADVKTWSDARIGICTYEVGVMATIAAEVLYPVQASQWSTDGKVLITFKPAVPRIDLTLNGTETHALYGVYNGDRLWEQDDRAAGKAFIKSVRLVADRALKRFPKPDGISADLPDACFEMRFGMTDANLPHFH